MKNTSFFIVVQILCLGFINGWGFDYNSCYQVRSDERMPLSIDNMIAIIENYEKDNSNTAPETIADALLYKYRTNGVVYNYKAQSAENQWAVKQDDESYKQELDDKLLKPSAIVPEDSLQPREECSIHLMLSHSTDYYPHPGVDYIWLNNYFKRKKRSSKFPNIPDDEEPAEHPVEFGVIQTSAGPISGGLLLAGIMSSASTKSYTVEELTDPDDSKLPKDISSLTIEPLYGTTVSGVLAKAAIQNMVDPRFKIGPIGMFGNCSACPRVYSLESSDPDGPYFLTRAEIFGALDGFIIGRYLKNKASSQSVTLSQILRMYYSDHGLYDPDLRACNRKDIYLKYKSDVSTTIQEQALNYMYAFQKYYPYVADKIKQNYGDSSYIEEQFLDYLSDIIDEVNSFISSYSYDDPGYYSCPTSSEEYKYETEVDLVVIYSPSGSTSDIEKQLEYIGLTARRVGVGYHRSRIAVLNGKSKSWISPMTNYSNIADYVCNYTTLTDYSVSSSQSFVDILNKLSEFYNSFYSALESDLDLTGRHSQVVLWTLPNDFDGDEDVMLRDWNTFNQSYPDVTFMFVGSKSSQTLNFLGDKIDDVILISTSSSTNPIDISTDIVNNIRKAPRMFYYAACDTKNSEYSKYNEDDHVYTTYVSPNFTTIIRIPPQNFHFSEKVKLNIKSNSNNNFRVCVSRTKSEPSESDGTKDTTCEDTSPYEYDFSYLCDRYVNQCQPIYISVTGNSAASSYCSDDYCIYPNQLEFEMKHEGMICSSCIPLPTFFLLLLFSLIVLRI